MDIINRLAAVPPEYRRLRIHITANQHWDNVATKVRTQIVCVHMDGYEELISDTCHSHADLPKYHAVIRFVILFRKIIKFIEEPKECFEIHFHDVGTYLIYSRMALPQSVSFRRWLREYTIFQMEFRLGCAEWVNEWRESILAGKFRQERKSGLTLEQQGVTEKKSFARQKKIRQELNLWQTIPSI